MFLEKLKLHNFKGFEDFEIDFHKQMTVIVGANGAGKTSVLEGAAIAVSTIFSKMDGLTGLGISNDQAYLKAFAVGDGQDVQPQFPIEIFAKMETETRTLEWKRSLNTPKGKTTIVDAKEMTDLGISFQNHLRNGDATLILPIIAYYGSGRLWDYHREKKYPIHKVNNRLNGYIDCLDGRANVKLMMNWFLKMTIEKYQNRELGIMDENPTLRAVFDAMESCYKKITGCNDVKVQYNLGTKELEVAYRENDGLWMRVPINQLSDGYKSTISLVADIAYRMAVLNPQLFGKICDKTDGIILIDEIELHMHPSWQRRILGILREIFPNIQFIVTTHSPQVLGEVDDSYQLIMLQKAKDNDIDVKEFVRMDGYDSNYILEEYMGTSASNPEFDKLVRECKDEIVNENFEKAEKMIAAIGEITDMNYSTVITLEGMLKRGRILYEKNHQG